MESDHKDREEGLLPNDLVDERYAEYDDVNDGIPVLEADGLTSEGGISNIEQHTAGSNQTLNELYRSHLRQLRHTVLIAIQRCKEKQELIDKRIQELEKQPVKSFTRKNWYHLFGYPYFKDKSFFPCPINDDQKEKLARNEIDYHKLPPIRRWTESDCTKLEQAVKANAIEKKSTGFLRRRGIILEKLKDTKIKQEEKCKLTSELNTIRNEIEKIKRCDLKTLCEDRYTDYDWLKITAEEFGDLRISDEVQAMWVLCRHPSVNRKHWTRAENAALHAIAQKHAEQNWAAIAAELNTNRSEFQCVVQYQRKVNTELIHHRWTEEEDVMLKYLIERCRVNDYIPWATIAMCMRNRTRQQVYNRWMFSINPIIRKGRFTVEEDCLILAGVKHFGEDFPRIVELLPGRTSAQINSRYKMSLARDGPLGQWTVEEDLRLLKLVEIHGKKWNWLAVEHFRTRSRNQIRHRYLYLEDWLSKNPDCSVSKAPRRDLGDLRKRNLNLWSTIQNALTASTKKRKGAKDIDKEDIELLKVTMAPAPENAKKPRMRGRRKKPLSKADKLLHQLLKVCYFLATGRNKVMYTEEEFQRRESMVLNVLNAVQSHLAFPFDESVISDDVTWNESDIRILLGLKQKYDERINSDTTRETSNMDTEVSSEGVAEGSSSMSSGNGGRNNSGHFSHRVHSQTLVPLYEPGEDISTSFPEVFPSFVGNLIGFRTLLLSRVNLKMWKMVPEVDVIAPQAERPSSCVFNQENKKCFSKEESARLFSERLFSLFFWPTQLVRMEPDFEDDTFIQNSSAVESISQSAEPPPKKKRKRTIRHMARSKKFSMRERWQKLREEKSKGSSEYGHPFLRNSSQSKRREAELALS